MKGHHRLDAATGLIHTLQPGGTVADCKMLVRDMKTQEQVKGKVKQSRWCPACEVERLGPPPGV